MSTDPQNSSYQRPPLEFKSSTFSVPVLVLSTDDLQTIEIQLQQKIKQAPEFFKSSPVLLDLQEINKREHTLDIIATINLLRDQTFLPIGIRGGTQKQNEAALKASLPKISVQNTHSAVSSPATPEKMVARPEPIEHEDDKTAHTKMLTQPIRSGQRIYAPGDLIILAQVSAGAEIMAEGNIHVYGTLRGRALAGVQGNTEARIFCSDLQAELVSIAGNYKISEDLDETVRNKPVQIYLNKLSLIIEDL